ncbi:MAG: DHA2 family efflux MFS transporter permease subunit, partial [Chloroflexota bacterium]
MAAAAAILPAQAEPAPFTMRSIMAPLVAIIIGVFMVVLDSTAVNVAIPSLVNTFHNPLSTLQWTVTGYTLAQAAVIPLAGWLSDRYGAKYVFLTSLVLFTIGSALCVTAQSSGMLITFRILQGLGGGFVLPVAMAYVYRLSPPEKVGAIMGLMGIPILFAPAIGPVLAGWLVQNASWRWIFLINVPIGVVGLIVGLRTLPRIGRQSVPVLDVPGMIFGPLAFAALCYGVSEGSTSWTSTQTLGGLIIGVLALVTFVMVELRSANPLLELRVFKSIHFSLAIVTQWVGVGALFGTLFMVPVFLQQIRGYGAFDTGLTLLPQAAAAALFMPISGILFDKIGARPLVVAGLVITALAGFLLSQVGIHTTGRDLIGPMALYGVGMGLMFMPLNTHLINTAPRNLVTRVTALTNALQQVISSLTIAGLATFLTSRPDYHQANAWLAAAAAKAQHGAGHVAASTALPAVPAHLFSLAFDETFRLTVGVALVGVVLGLFLKRIRSGANAEV